VYPSVLCFTALLKPMMLDASTRNTLVCVPIALEGLKDDFKVKREPCDLFIPLGFATVRFGRIAITRPSVQQHGSLDSVARENLDLD
jgi:hypothetical protein